MNFLLLIFFLFVYKNQKKIQKKLERTSKHNTYNKTKTHKEKFLNNKVNKKNFKSYFYLIFC